MKSFLISTCLVLVLTACQQAPEQSYPGLDELVRQELAERQIPGMAVGIVYRGEPVVSRGYGYARVASGDTVTERTVFQLGSVTKTFTGHLLASYQAREKIALDASMASLFPDSVRFPVGPGGETITIGHVATHSAAFPRYPANLGRVDPDPIRGYSMEAMHRGIALVEVDTTPGSAYHYSNFGYGVLGTGLEHFTGESLADQMQHHIFDHLGMTSTSLIKEGVDTVRLATPYLEVNPLKQTDPWDMGSMRGAGNLFSTVDDLNRFMIHLMDSLEVNEIQQTPRLQINENWAYGLGCFITRDTSRKTYFVHHGGDIDGYASQLTIFPEYNLGVVTLTNWGSGRQVSPVFNAIRDWAVENRDH